MSVLGFALELPGQAVWVSVCHTDSCRFSWLPVYASPKAADIQPLPPGPLKESLNSLALACLLASQDRTCESVEDTESGRMVKKMKKRICLVLDCLCAHDFSDKTADLINLQHYVIKEKRLSERETVVIFYDVVRVVEALHQVRPRTHMPQKKHLSWLLFSRKLLGPDLTWVCFAAPSVQREVAECPLSWVTHWPKPAMVPVKADRQQPFRAPSSNSQSVEKLSYSHRLIGLGVPRTPR